MKPKAFIIAAVVALLGLCNAAGKASGAEQAAKEFDVVIRYTAEVKGSKAVIRGTLKNVRFARMEEIELKVAALDGNGKTLGEKRELLIPVSLPMDEETQFAVEVPLKQEGKPAKLRFLYRYRPNEGERDEPLQMRSITAPFDAASSAPE